MICLGVAIYPVNYELGLAIRGAINENISQSKFPARRRGKHKNQLYPRLQDRRLYQNTTFFRKCGDRQSQIEHIHTRHRLPTFIRRIKTKLHFRLVYFKRKTCDRVSKIETDDSKTELIKGEKHVLTTFPVSRYFQQF